MRAILLALAVTLAAARPADARDACAHGYRGARIDVDFKAASIQEVFRLLAKLGNANIVVPDEVRGEVTVKLKHVPWDQVMCAIAKSKRLHVEEDQGVYTITP